MGRRKRARQRRKVVRRMTQRFADFAIDALAEFAGNILARASVAEKKRSEPDRNEP
jgi:hypothetical protein